VEEEVVYEGRISSLQGRVRLAPARARTTTGHGDGGRRAGTSSLSRSRRDDFFAPPRAHLSRAHTAATTSAIAAPIARTASSSAANVPGTGPAVHRAGGPWVRTWETPGAAPAFPTGFSRTMNGHRRGYPPPLVRISCGLSVWPRRPLHASPIEYAQHRARRPPSRLMVDRRTVRPGPSASKKTASFGERLSQFSPSLAERRWPVSSFDAFHQTDEPLLAPGPNRPRIPTRIAATTCDPVVPYERAQRGPTWPWPSVKCVCPSTNPRYEPSRRPSDMVLGGFPRRASPRANHARRARPSFTPRVRPSSQAGRRPCRRRSGLRGSSGVHGVRPPHEIRLNEIRAQDEIPGSELIPLHFSPRIHTARHNAFANPSPPLPSSISDPCNPGTRPPRRTTLIEEPHRPRLEPVQRLHRAIRLPTRI